ncbi:hypothetical protein L7F22_031551 [Adiantum nelumboides]|nr:hypothetical protein [Adiantum nelumboides]
MKADDPTSSKPGSSKNLIPFYQAGDLRSSKNLIPFYQTDDPAPSKNLIPLYESDDPASSKNLIPLYQTDEPSIVQIDASTKKPNKERSQALDQIPSKFIGASRFLISRTIHEVRNAFREKQVLVTGKKIFVDLASDRHGVDGLATEASKPISL